MKENSLECQFCGRTFVSRRNDARYCCNSHRQLAYFKREGIGYSWNSDSESEASNAEVNNIHARRLELQNISATVDELKSMLDLKQQKRADELQTVYEEMTASFDRMNKGKTLTEVRRRTLKIIEALFEQDANGEITKHKIKWLMSDVNLLLNSVSFENVQAEFIPVKFIQEILLPHLEEVASSFRRSRERYLDYKIPPEIKSELEKLNDEFKFT